MEGRIAARSGSVDDRRQGPVEVEGQERPRAGEPLQDLAVGPGEDVPHHSRGAERVRQLPAPAHREPLPPPQARRVHQHPPRPAVDVELGQQGAHRPHPVALLLLRHEERRLEGRAGLLQVVRVDAEGLGQLAGGAREVAEDQHALLVVPCRDELLRHQVHAVVQAAHVAHVRRPVVAEDGGRLVVRTPQDHGPVAARREALVDASGDLDHVLVQLPVVGDDRRGSARPAARR